MTGKAVQQNPSVLCDARNRASVYSREEEGGSDWEQGLPGC